MHRHNVLKQICGLLRIPIRNAPFGRKCQCSINFARWKKNYLKSSAKLHFKLPQKNAKISKCKTIKFLPIPGMQWDWFRQNKMENEGNGRKKIVQNKNATSKTYLISANVITPIRLISDFKRRIYDYGCSLYRSQRDRVSILPWSRITDCCF